MARKKIFTIGFELPGGDFETISYDSDQSLLDADIILYEVGFGHHANEDYQGTPLFNRNNSAQVGQNIHHWYSELTAATNAGKLVIVFLAKPLTYYRYTGQQTFSGTGRSRTTTNVVTIVESYSAIPKISSAEAKSGREVRLTKEAAYIASYWSEFGAFSAYEAFIEGGFSHVLLTTKAGSKTVAAAFRGNGSLLFLPPLRYDDETFLEFDPEKEEDVWTEEAISFGKRLTKALTALAESLASNSARTPPPPWALDSAFATEEEGVLQSKIADVSETISELHRQRTGLEEQLHEAGSARALLYEQGKPLEHAVRNALILMDFSAAPFADGDSEFDVVFQSPEGRCLGEVEGKDNRAVNIDKMSQLERNLQEDFARDDVTEFAKGVLFGNSERLKTPAERGEAFTLKTFTAAKRAHIALIRTSDLFDCVRYLRTHPDPEYAKRCREKIFEADGVIVIFPPPPVGTATRIQEEKSDEIKP